MNSSPRICLCLSFTHHVVSVLCVGGLGLGSCPDHTKLEQPAPSLRLGDTFDWTGPQWKDLGLPKRTWLIKHIMIANENSQVIIKLNLH